MERLRILCCAYPGIISFDLNDLKKTNDLYGHLEGDRLLNDFAELLKDCFGKSSTVARMGGDEFIVFFEDISVTDTEGLLENMRKKTEELNRTRTPLPLSYA